MKLYADAGKGIPPELLIEGQRGILITKEIEAVHGIGSPRLGQRQTTRSEAHVW